MLFPSGSATTKCRARPVSSPEIGTLNGDLNRATLVSSRASLRTFLEFWATCPFCLTSLFAEQAQEWPLSKPTN